MSKVLSAAALEKIDKMVERVARKAGYTGKENMTYKEILQAKFEQERAKMQSKINKYRRKLSWKSEDTDFAEEIRTYLHDGLVDLMNEGYSEDEAIKITMEKFDEAELNNNGFQEFIDAFGGFGLGNCNEMQKWYWYEKNGEAIGLFYATFVVLGTAIGAFSGYMYGHTLANIAINAGLGFSIGVGLGLLSHAIIALKNGR